MCAASAKCTYDPHYASKPTIGARRASLLELHIPAIALEIHASASIAYIFSQQARHYATEVPKPSSGSSKYIYGGVAAVGLVAWGVSSRSRRKKIEEEFLKSKEGQKIKSEWDAKTGKETAKPTFTGGDQGFIDLKLESVQNVNHNTKKFRFALPDPDAVSGLPITCE